MITGDKHQHSVRNVPGDYRDVASTPLATEFVGTSITTGGDDPRTPTHGGDANNPHILYDGYDRGYVLVDLGREVWRTDFRAAGPIRVRTRTPGRTLESWAVARAEPGAVPVAAV